ncbi:hypothetical protein [Haloarchaeobius sp. DYHT-AS-18]|uniref:hypothetical protein n=1 Tax=Haloarchaeobius sp. DYHT-AS-18 TaxID=3446117 RepID=UPI003EB729F1
MDELWLLAGETELRYVASMRAWNCCHDGVVPHDGYPKEPDSSSIEGPETDDED